jgi:hypothetical protein
MGHQSHGSQDIRLNYEERRDISFSIIIKIAIINIFVTTAVLNILVPRLSFYFITTTTNNNACVLS